MRKFSIMLLCLLCLIGCKKEEEQDKEKKDQEEIVEIESRAFDVVDYKVYCADFLTNRFAIVKVRIKDEKSINYKLSDFSTNENINLSDYKQYSDELDKNGIVLKDYNIVTNQMKSEKNSAIFNLYCPIISNNLKELLLTFDNKLETKIDLTKNNQKITNNYTVDEKTISDEEYEITVKNVYSTLGEALFEDDEIGYYPVNSEIYAIVINVVSLNGNVVLIKEAEYVTSDNNSFKAMDKRYSTESAKNILEKSIINQTLGCLLFETNNPQSEPITYKGILRLKINDKWYNVDINL